MHLMFQIIYVLYESVEVAVSLGVVISLVLLF